MAAQVPPDVLGSAIGVLVYSLICLFSGFFFLWMVWVHDERKSYVAMLGFFVTLHTLASVMQQIHTIARWRDIKIEQHQNTVANAGDPELNITGASTGLDLVLFYIQYYSYNVESLLVFFWAVELANSIFQLRFTKMYRFHASSVAKATAALVPAAQMVLLRFSAVHKSTVGYMALADAIMIGCFAAGSLVLLAILCRYLHSRLTLASWSVGYGRQQPSGQGGTNGTRYGRPMPRRTIYDRWLVLRFSVAFCALSLFQIVVVNFQLRAAGTNDRASVPPEPDLSAGRARGDFTLFAPAPTAVLFVILVFGTTRTFREYMWNLFVPRALRDRFEERARARKRAQSSSAAAGSAPLGGSVSVVHSAMRDDVEAGNGNGVVLGLRDLGASQNGGGSGGSAKSDEWPILKKGLGQMGRGRR
ncbi:hypothetical protein C7999DRAFT_15333 [Corynascus novoguineensis]|uniref:Uncharacterized protein n=1 Tax=Corynascus novoguineensis TaxID=1126955 RepID=A0AAN7CSG7_9PEZI|nr:hypothetical protein C7999DRAFT_15333 [Corynascus novoguineensis]